MTLQEMILKAKAYKACNIIDTVETFQDAADALFSPQGQEFFENTGYPDTRAIKSLGKELDGFYGDRSVTLGNPPNLCIGGRGKHKLTYDGLPENVPIVLLNNANAEITLNNYAVVKIVKYGECEVIIGGDGTGVVL